MAMSLDRRRSLGTGTIVAGVGGLVVPGAPGIPMIAAGIAIHPEIDLSVEGIEHVIKEFGRHGRRVEKKSSSLTRHYGARLYAQVQAAARQAFEVDDYLAQTYLSVRRGRGGNTEAVVGSTAPQSVRLEYGFVGRDAKGRFVSQPPRPHFRPALASIGGEYVEAIKGLFS